MRKAISSHVPMYEMEESNRKRLIHEVPDAEAPPNASRLRVSPARVVEKSDDPSDPCYEYPSDSDFTTTGRDDSDNGDMRASSSEHDGGEDIKNHHSVAEQTPDSQHPALRGIPRSWDEASQADRILVTMNSKGLGWDDIGKAWKKETGQDAAHIVLLNRYNRLKNNVQCLKEGDGERLLAAVREVKAVFEREKWQLVKNAMARAGAAEYPKDLIRKQYKILARSLPSIKSTAKHKFPPVPTKAQMKDSGTTRGSGETNMALDKPPTNLWGLPSVSTVSTPDGPSSNKAMDSASPPSAATLTDQYSRDIETTEKGSKNKDAAEAPQLRRTEFPKKEGLSKPGSLTTNAILVDDTGPTSHSVPKAISLAVPISEMVPTSTAPGSRRSPDSASLSAPRPRLNPGTTASRVGSATNRGPARLTNFHKASDDDATRKQRNALNSLSDPTRSGPGESSTSASAVSSAISLRQGTPQHKTQNVPSNDQQQISTQQDSAANNKSPQTQSVPQPASLMATARSQPASTPEPDHSNHTNHQAMNPKISGSSQAILHRLPAEEFSNRSLPYQKPPERQIPTQIGHIYPRSPIQPIEVRSQKKESTPATVTNAEADERGSSERPNHSFNASQIEYMQRCKSLNDSNRSKAWYVIARECGVVTTPGQVPAAPQEVGCPGSLNTPKPPDTVKHDISIASTESTTYKSPYTSAAATQTPPIAEPSAASITPTRAMNTPTRVTTSTPIEAPNTRSRRGRPFGSRNKEKSEIIGEGSSMSPSQKTSGSGREGHFRSAESKAAQSASMKATWARRKERGLNGRKGSSSKPSTVGKKSMTGSSAATFAAEILAAAAARHDSTPTPAPQTAEESAPYSIPEPSIDEPVDLLTGETMFAQHYDDPTVAKIPRPPPAKKIVRRSINSRPA